MSLDSPPPPHLYTDNRQQQIIGCDAFLIAITAVVVLGRMILRKTTGAGYWWDDWLAVISLFMAWASPISNLVGLRFDYGRHAVLAGPENVSKYLKDLYIFEVIWTFTIPVIKSSFLLFLNRTFPHPRVRLFSYGIAFFVLTWMIWAGFVTIFQCTPVSFFWDSSVSGHCINGDAFYIAAGAVNVFTDVCLLSIPIPIILKLHTTATKKVGLVILFSLGFLVTIVSIIRLVYLGDIDTADITWTDTWGGLWSSIEVCLDVVTNSLPVVAPLFISAVNKGGQAWTNLRSKPSFSHMFSTKASDQSHDATAQTQTHKPSMFSIADRGGDRKTAIPSKGIQRFPDPTVITEGGKALQSNYDDEQSGIGLEQMRAEGAESENAGSRSRSRDDTEAIESQRESRVYETV